MRTFPVVLTVVGVLLAGCDGSGAPVASDPPRPSSNGSMPPKALGSLPPIPRSFDMTRYVANPCDLLDKADFDVLGFAGSFVVVPTNADNPRRNCEVGGGREGGLLHLTVRTDAQPLQEAFADASGKYEFTNAVDLAGLPAVVRAQSVQYSGACQVIVATGKQQGFELYHDPSSNKGGVIGICGRLATVADSVLRKLGA